jgi:hypothetical protein
MPTARFEYNDLPSEVRAAITERTGPIRTVAHNHAGLNSAFSARIHAEGGDVFLKGLRSDARSVWTQAREAEINPWVRPLAPELYWRVELGGWDILGFEPVSGRSADYSPTSPDLPLVVDVLCRLGELPLPPLELRAAEQRLTGFVDDPADAALFQGDALLHTDWNNHNVLVGEPAEARVVDWGWATRGQPWLDAAYWAIWLIAAGHSPASAENWASKVPSWASASDLALAAFARANERVWRGIAGAQPDEWSARMLTAASRWRGHRDVGAR